MTVSRRHAEFRREARHYVVTDVGSLNGTYVNRERIETATLERGRRGADRQVQARLPLDERRLRSSGGALLSRQLATSSRLLREEFPDITISKIRFLESRGLLVPERTPSGYRKFYEPDVDRLRWILRQQREHFLPLKVIKGRLENGMTDPDEPAPAPVRARRPAASSARPNRCSSGGDAAVEHAQRQARMLTPGPVGRGRRLLRVAVARAGLAGLANGENAADRAPRRWPGADGPAEAGHRTRRAPGRRARRRTPSRRLRQASRAGAGHPRRRKAAHEHRRRPSRRIRRRVRHCPTSRMPRLVDDVGRSRPAAPARSPRRRFPARGFPGRASRSPSSPTRVVSRWPGRGARELRPHRRADRGGGPLLRRGCRLVAKLAAGFAPYGIEARHLRVFKHAADRQTGLFAQVVTPLLRQRNPEARSRAVAELTELAELGEALMRCFSQATLRELTGG